jgi:succinoglycan biosynthesis transport protein ExoP
MPELDISPPGLRHSGSWWIVMQGRVGRFLRLALRFWWLPFFTAAAGLAIAAWFIYQQKTVYVSSGRMMVSSRINLQQGAVYSEDLGNFIGTQIELMTSGEVRKRAMHRVAGADPTLQPVRVELKVKLLPLTSIFFFSATGAEPRYTQRLLDATMDEYIATKKEMRSSKSETTQTAILDEISQIERETGQTEDALLEFQRKNNIGFLQQEGNSAGDYVAKLNRQLADLKTQYNLLNSLNVDQIIDLNQRDPSKAADFAAHATDADLQNLNEGGLQPEAQYIQAKQQLELLKAQRDGLTKVLRPKHPQVVELDEKIEQQKTVIEALRQENIDGFHNQRDSISHQIDNLEVSIKEWDGKALSLSERLAEYNRIKEKLDRSKALNDRLLNNLHDVNVTQNLDQDTVSILEKASPPDPVKPGVVQAVILGSIAGLILGLGLLVFMDHIDDRVLSLADVRARFEGAILAQIPREKHSGALEPVRRDDPRHAFTEAFRALRSSIIYLPVEGVRPKTLLLAGATPGEGKSTIALNLALTMAKANVRVLLVDGDLRRGGLHRSLKCPSEPGLSDLLAGQASLKEVLSSASELDFIARGKILPNSGELFLSSAMDRFIRDVYSSYDFILFDSSPIMAADDAASLAPKIDATLFVVRFAHSSCGGSLKAIDLLRDRQANVVGIVCNDVRQMDQEYYYYKYPEYYGAVTSKLKVSSTVGS